MTENNEERKKNHFGQRTVFKIYELHVYCWGGSTLNIPLFSLQNKLNVGPNTFPSWPEEQWILLAVCKRRELPGIFIQKAKKRESLHMLEGVQNFFWNETMTHSSLLEPNKIKKCVVQPCKINIMELLLQESLTSFTFRPSQPISFQSCCPCQLSPFTTMAMALSSLHLWSRISRENWQLIFKKVSSKSPSYI